MSELAATKQEEARDDLRTVKKFSDKDPEYEAEYSRLSSCKVVAPNLP